jgi:tRNA-binding EMAP/Myf-like protein
MYTAYITQLINVRKHPNADRLQLADVMGNQVVIGLDHTEGEVGIFFPADGQLSKEYAEANDLIARKDPITGERVGGFLEEKRRIKAQKFRGVKSEGLWMPLSSLDYIGDPKTRTLKVGTELITWKRTDGGIFEICQRYETEATKQAAKQQNSKIRSESIYFPRHVETDQFMAMVDQIPIGSRLYISEKLHGTSHREGYTWMPRKLNKIQQLINRIGQILINRMLYNTFTLEHVIGTRRTVLGTGKPDFYNNVDFRHDVAHAFLNPGEIIYGEIVGYITDNTLIMPEHDVRKLNDKKLLQRYGDTIRYTYGLNSGEHSLYIYRVLEINRITGERYEYTHDELVRFANERNLLVVPFLYYTFYIGDTKKLVDKVNELVEGDSQLSSRHIREGVVIRVETPDPDGRIYFLKHKSFAFKVMEGIVKNNDAIVDIEEAS